MTKQTPLVQALVAAALTAVLLSGMHIFMGTRPGDPIVFAFIAAMTVIGAVITYIRARATLRASAAGQQSPLMWSYQRIILTFLGLFVYGYAINVLFIQEPGDSIAHALGFGLALGAALVVLAFRKSRQLSTSFWKTLVIVVPIGVGAGVVTWALEKLV